MNLNRIHISTKLWAFIALVVVSICSVAVIGMIRSAAILGEGRVAQAAAVDLVLVSTRWTGMTETNATRNHAIMVSSSPATLEAFENAVKATSAQVSELQKKMETMAQTDADKAQLKKIGDLRAVVLDWREKTRKVKADGNDAEALKLMSSNYLPAMAAYIGGQQELVRMQTDRVAQIQAETEARRSANTNFILIGLGVILLAILAGTSWLVRSIREPLEQANLLAAHIAQGDLSHSVVTHREDEFGALLESLSTMNESLGRMVTEVRSSTESIATASAEIAHGNNDLAQRTEQTSSNLQGTASSMDALTGTVQHSAENARQASTLAASASSVAQRGGAVVTQVVTTMQEINDSSKKIADIIAVIDGIAFQTNILALNAAVEAARAGEQGRGFAVVASEVRSLAGRSAEAAKEIRSLISRSVEKVESGTKLVTDAGTTMDEIVDSVRKVADVISEITAAATEQSSGIAGVNQSIGDLDQMTQQNAALVEQSAAAAESLRSQADRLKQAVSVFKVSGQFTGTSVAPAKHRPAIAPKTFHAPTPVKLTPAKVSLPKPPKQAAPRSAPPAKQAAAPAASGGNDDWETF